MQEGVVKEKGNSYRGKTESKRTAILGGLMIQEARSH